MGKIVGSGSMVRFIQLVFFHLMAVNISADVLPNVNAIPIGIMLDYSETRFAEVINKTVAEVKGRDLSLLPYITYTNVSSSYRYKTDGKYEVRVRDVSLLPYIMYTNVFSSYRYKTDVCKEVLFWGVFVTISTENSMTETSVMSIMETLQMPFVTFSDQDLLNESWRYKIRMTPSYIDVLSALQVFYSWEHVFYFYSDQAGLARFEKLYTLLDAKGNYVVEIDLRQLDPSLPDFYDILRNLDSKYTDENSRPFNEKVLILDLSSTEMIQRVLDQLVDVGMTRDNYHIVPATLTMNNLDLEKLRFGGVTVTGFQLNGLNGTDTMGLLAADTVSLVYKALQEMEDRATMLQPFIRRQEFYNGFELGLPCHKADKPFQIGSRINTAIKQTAFMGRTGLVRFNNKGQRVGHMFDILQQVRQETIQKVGVWSEATGLVTNEKIRAKKNSTRNAVGFFNGTFIITTVLVEPYAMKKKTSGPNGTQLYEGYAIDLATKLSEIIGFNFVIRPVHDNDHGKKRPDSSWTGMIGELIDGKADMAIGDLTITSDRERVVDFSTPFMNLGISIMIRKPEKQKPSVFSFMEPLSNMVWLCIALSFTGVSVVIYLISRISPNEWKVEEAPDGEVTIENEFTAQNSAWFVAGALMCQGSEISPMAPSNRIVGSAWWLFTLIIISSYTANLAAFLTVENIVIPIKNIQDLANHPTIKFGTMNSGTTRAFFENSNSTFFKEMWNKMAKDPSLLMDGAAAGIAEVRSSKGKYAFLFESTTNEYANQRKPCNTLKVGENLDSKNYGVATPIGHKLRHQVTLGILRLHETGELNKLMQTWWYDKGQCSNDDGGSSIKALSLSNVAGVFYILIGGLLIAMLCALLEFIFKSVKDAKKFKKSLRASMKSKARLSIAGESDDSPYFFLPRPSYRISIEPPPLNGNQ